MKILLLTLTFLATSLIHAQVIPGENPGDLGWIILGQDTLDLVRAADGHVWLQQNLGSTQIATSAVDPDAFGDLYQWGRWTDGHQLRTSAAAQTSTLVNNDPSGLGGGSAFFFIGASPSDWWASGDATDTWQEGIATSVNGVDPCSLIGVEWQLPSKDDWMIIITGEGISDLSTAFGSNLKLTAAGSRDGQTGTIINAGQFGNYWSSTTSGQYAKDLTIGETFVNPDDDAYRSYGMSVRCMNKFLHTGMNERTEAGALLLYPNPSDGNFKLHTTSTMHSADLYDMLGRSIRSVPVLALSATLDLTDDPNGTYSLHVHTSSGMFSRKVIITR